MVAGGAGSLGSAIVDDLTAAGARVAILDIQSPSAERTSSEPLYIRCDAADDAAASAAIATLSERFGKIHALVNCLGLIHSEPLIDLMSQEQPMHSIAAWDRVVRSNLTATFVLGRHIAAAMAATRTKGVIVNFSSVSASGNPGQTAYAAAKAGIEAMTRVWARELGPYGIRCIAIAPGFIDTTSTRTALSDETLTDLKRKTPLLRLGKPGDIASAVRFAIENDFISGTTISIDGALRV